MRAYHFVKYNESTSLDNLIAQTEEKTILCFDFEDSIQSCLSPINTVTLKTKYRAFFKSTIDKSSHDISQINIGIRINVTDSPEYIFDISAIAGIKHISTIFLPKIERPEQILNLQKDLQRIGVNYNEIIPVVETKTGMSNLEDILKINTAKIKKIAFGHCDYNFDNHIYPYFHQDSREYWTWITKIFEIIKPYNLCLVNSPFLQLETDGLFLNMLSDLYSICGNASEQITLTRKQTKLCNSFTNNKLNIVRPKIINRLDLEVPKFFAEKFIESFEKTCNDKGFAITEDRTILSPHEYLSSINYRNKIGFPEVNFTFVGGCFPVQGNLCFENLFHQNLKRKIENARELIFNVNIIRYERFKNCITKIAGYIESKPIDIFVFSIRPEPFLRLVKLYYKYIDQSTHRKKWSLNFPFFNTNNPEKYDLLNLDTRFNPNLAPNNSIIRKTFINLNYILGSLFGNDNSALRKYLKLVNEIINFSNKNSIELIILGPPIRTNTIIESRLSRKLDRFFRKSLNISQVKFISGSDLTKNGENLFTKNGIYANEKYHELISERLFEIVLPLVDKMAGAKKADPQTGIFHSYEKILT